MWASGRLGLPLARLVAQPFLVWMLFVCWLVGSGPEVADCRMPGDTGASAASLLGGVRVLRLWCCFLLHWWLKPSPEASARLLAGRARS